MAATADVLVPCLVRCDRNVQKMTSCPQWSAVPLGTATPDDKADTAAGGSAAWRTGDA